MPALKTANTEVLNFEKFEIVNGLLPLRAAEILDLKDVARPAPTQTQMERLNKFQIGLFKVVSLIKEKKIEEAHALYKEACNAFFSQPGEFIYDIYKDAFVYVSEHFDEFAKWFLSNEKAK